MTLATTVDFETITGRCLDVGQKARVQTLLGLAESTVLASVSPQLIAAGSTADLVVEPVGGAIYLPQRPVRAVTSLTVGGDDVSLDDIVIEPGGRGRPARILMADGSAITDTAVVSYTHGWETVPGNVVGMVVAIADAAFEHGSQAAPTQRTAGPFSESRDPGSVQAPGLSLTDAQRAELKALCGVRHPGSVPVGSDRP